MSFPELQSEKIDALTKALIEAKTEIRNALIDSTNPHFKSNFASLESVLEALTPLTKHGLVLIQGTAKIDGELNVVTTLAHSSGQWIRSFTPVLSKDPNDPQKMGSGISYARRYAAAAMGGIGERDDDGNSAATPKQQKSKPHPSRATPQKQAPAQQEPPWDNEGGLGGDHVINIGRLYKGLSIKQAIERDGLPKFQNWIHFLEDSASKAGKPLNGDAVSVKVNFERYRDEIQHQSSFQDEPWPDEVGR